MSTGRAPVGFTGTQIGMSPRQREDLRTFLSKYASEFHHGDCVGADEQAHMIALEVGIPLIVIHPPNRAVKRAFCATRYEHKNSQVVERAPREYLDRNHDIVDETMGLLVGPKSNEEEMRSGTWATYRYAKKTGKWYLVLSR